MTPLRLRPGVHIPVDLPGARYLRRALGDPHIFTYFHRYKGTVVVATWLNKLMGLALEHYVLENPSQWRDAIMNVRWQRSPSSIQWARAEYQRQKRLNEVDTDQAQESATNHCAMVEFLRKRTSAHRQDHPGWSLL